MSGTKGMKHGKIGANIDKEQFEKLCGMFCTIDEICGWFHVSVDCLDRWVKFTYGKEKTIKQVANEYSAMGKISIRRTQLKQSEKFPVMAIWLGKQYLGQKDTNNDTEEQRIMVENATNVLVAIKDKADEQETTATDDEPENGQN